MATMLAKEKCIYFTCHIAWDNARIQNTGLVTADQFRSSSASQVPLWIGQHSLNPLLLLWPCLILLTSSVFESSSWVESLTLLSLSTVSFPIRKNKNWNRNFEIIWGNIDFLIVIYWLKSTFRLRISILFYFFLTWRQNYQMNRIDFSP